ncbi:apoptosis regulator BAX-like [Alligator mississippiensis]|uniref:Apoptosis regulator BAX-like n=1 Tax=Alligator mississippiensis TaxID=8496 RepID=A0A151NK05_ALLMI|nr:apoptosis regulator BAX-like [Alligator mississippiensis]
MWPGGGGRHGVRILGTELGGVGKRWGLVGAESLSCILRIGGALLRGFILTLFQQSPGTRPVTFQELGGEITPTEPPVTSLLEGLLQVWRSMSQNSEIDSLVDMMSGQPPLKALAQVAEEVFADSINWGRVVVFFYFTYRVTFQALSSSGCLRAVVDWALEFLRERITGWIQQQGGWDSALTYPLASD